MKRTLVVSLMVIIFSGTMVVHPAFAHTFVQNSDASLIAQIQEFKVESKLMADNISNNTLSQWHLSKSQEYWGNNEIGVLSQTNSTLATQLSTSIDNLYSMAGQQNADPTMANQKADETSQLLDQAESQEVSSSSQNNSTVQALAIVNVINEVLKDYGTAIGSTIDLTNMDNMNMNSSSSGNGMSGMSGMSKTTSTPIVNVAAYQSAQALAGTAQNMFSNLQSIAPSNTSPYLDKVGTALNELKQKIDARDTGMDVMMVVHLQIHPNLISAFDISAVPEFPIPILLVMISFIGVIAMSRIFQRK
ncbi:hypothetical protein DYY67_0359 [Candidatus Nitrosotalea sp. TS]|uniref:hypothetical protein n=2 Tax=Candidatus Nitrosotalea sp. TS TaxID=2341020 RepID=UPI00140AECFA|nr:hypothetical protein [Candidatus Nitrosotalea sp. TS]NHI04601.1 hypothetical protein [Candidatus Nitrosotalea sp. TS]